MSTQTIDTPTETTKPKPRSLLRSSGVFASMTFISRITGFMRDMIWAQVFGVTASMDAFMVAFRIPNFMRRLFAEGAFSQAFIPVLAEYHGTRTLEETRSFISRVSGTLGSALLVVTIICMLATPLIVTLFAPGFSTGGHRYELASQLLRITFPYLFFISLAAMAGAVLNTFGSFALAAFAPVLLNVALISAAFFGNAYLKEPVTALSWGVFAAGILQLLFLLPALSKRHLLVKPTMDWRGPEVKRVMKLMLPALFGVSVGQINLFVDTLFASYLPVGSIQWLYYSDRLMNFPLGVFGVAIATVILPSLSKQHADQSPERFSLALDWGVRMVLLLGVPSAIGIAWLSLPLLATLFAHGNFTATDVIQTQKSLIAFSLGIPFFMLIKVLASGFYARHNITTPVRIGVISMIVNTVLILLFISPLKHGGLALATTLAAVVNSGLLFLLLKYRDEWRPNPGWIRFFLQLLISLSVMSAWLYYWSSPVDTWLQWSSTIRTAHLLFQTVTAMILFLLALQLSGFRWSSIRHVT